MRVRTFELVNAKGQIFSLMDIDEGCIFKEPENLGYGYTSEFQRLGNTYIEALRTINQSQIPGNLEFKNYDNYRKFIDYIESAESLRWKCTIPYISGAKTYFKDIVFQEIGKNDLFTEEDKLVVPVTFNCISLWYEENTIIYNITPQENEIRWDFMWDSRFIDYSTRNLEYVNTGHTEAPILVEMDGHLVNPKIELYVEGQLYQTVKITVEIQEYEKLLYGTRENDFYINKQNTDGTLTSLFSLDYIEFENDNVIRLPANKSCELRLTADNEVLNAQVTILPQYKAV